MECEGQRLELFPCSTCFQLSRAEIISVCHQTWLFHMGSEDQTQVFKYKASTLLMEDLPNPFTKLLNI